MGICFEQKKRVEFKERFEHFISIADGMYSEDKESIHLSASDNIVRLMMEEINWKTTLTRKTS
jgi:hypothetical protein